MATVAITPVQLSADTGVVITQGAGTAIVEANTNTIAYPKEGKLLLLVDSDHADTALTVAAGFGVNAGQGTVSYAVGNTIQHLIVVGNSAQLKNADGLISITYATNSAGYVRAFYLP